MFLNMLTVTLFLLYTTFYICHSLWVFFSCDLQLHRRYFLWDSCCTTPPVMTVRCHFKTSHSAFSSTFYSTWYYATSTKFQIYYQPALPPNRIKEKGANYIFWWIDLKDPLIKRKASALMRLFPIKQRFGKLLLYCYSRRLCNFM